MIFIFSPLEQAMLGEHIRYLKHGCATYRKFFGAMENQVFIEKKALFEGFDQDIRNLSEYHFLKFDKNCSHPLPNHFYVSYDAAKYTKDFLEL